MRTINQVLDKALRLQKVKSDYKLGLCLGIGQTSISSYRLGKSLPDEKAAAKLAAAIDEKPDLLLVEIQAQRVKDPEVREMWANVARRLQAGVSSIKMMLLIAIVSIAAGAMPAWAAVYFASVSANQILYTSWNIKNGGKKVRQCRADRMEHAKRFRAMLADLGLKHPDAAKLPKKISSAHCSSRSRRTKVVRGCQFDSVASVTLSPSLRVLRLIQRF